MLDLLRGRGPDREHTARIRAAARRALGLDDAAHVMVSELRCSEPDCPDVETVIAVLEEGAQRTWRVAGAAESVTDDMVTRALTLPPTA
jgi:hypothetical protein